MPNSPLIRSGVRVVGLKAVETKLAGASARILAQNRLLVGDMMKAIKPIVEAETPIGPGHFGYHLRNSYTTSISSRSVVTTGVLKSPSQGYWREYGTLGRFAKTSALAGYVSSFGGNGERALFVAHKAADSVRRFIRAYYGGMTRWWRL